MGNQTLQRIGKAFESEGLGVSGQVWRMQERKIIDKLVSGVQRNAAYC